VSRLVIDPVTRVSGHLRIEAEVAGGQVIDAWSSGTMFRGIEALLVGHDPRDAWLLAERICGSCSGAHGLASARAVENALSITIPPNARLLRNMLAGIGWIADLITGFYQRAAFDWADVAGAARADPWAASRLAGSTNPTSGDTADALARVERELGGMPTGLFWSDAWDHPAHQLTPEADLILFAHYLRALDLQRTLARAITTLGGKDPHPQTFLVGGMALTPPWGGPTPMANRGHPDLPERTTPAALSSEGLAAFQALLVQVSAFVGDVLVPDAVAIVRAYPQWVEVGRGTAGLLAYGEFPQDDSPAPSFLLPRGRLMDGSLDQGYHVDEQDVRESVAHAWYEDESAGPRPASQGQTLPRYEGPAAPVASLEGWPRYSYVKAPRYAGLVPMETGAAARMMVGYVAGSSKVHQAVDPILAAAGVELPDLQSSVGRILARAAEASVLAPLLGSWLDELRTNLATGDLAVADITSWHPDTWPAEASGFALGETSRGALGHWVTIRDRRVAGYQVVDGSTWNLSPRDDDGRRGPLESALIGTPVADLDRPLELLRTIHAFDPCGGCAAHAFGIRARRVTP